MADEQKPKASKKVKATEAKNDTAAKATDSAAGKIAAPAVAEPAPAPLYRKSTKPAKLQKKNNPHLPRKLKKAQKKAAAAISAPTRS
jgi:hypothetical protein